MRRLAISTWTLHRELGAMYRQAEHGSKEMIPNGGGEGRLSLLETPAELQKRGIAALEVCHFHFPSLENAYLNQFRAALDEAGIELYSLLIDTGDIAHPDDRQRQKEIETIRFWLRIAAQIGASHARVVAGGMDIGPQNGGAKDHPVIRQSAETLLALAREAAETDVQVNTENFRPLTKTAENLLAILDLCEGEVGLCADFGNYRGDNKYDQLAQIIPRANVLHAKAHYPTAGQMEQKDFEKCLDLADDADFNGPYSLIFDGPGSEWESVKQIQEVVQRRIH
ncbi:MAG: TIM barrel protein [Candidatus Poribacteria bacterium]|nr:TIM barrel protein [Candidatus Poribacteria bacterium]